MAQAAKSVCLYPGCGLTIPSGSRCDRHKPIARIRKDFRQGARERGYGNGWPELRKRYIDTHPLCAECERRGFVKPAREVDHIVPFDGLADPLRLDWNNLQSLCRPCHARKTHQDRNRHRNGAEP